VPASNVVFARSIDEKGIEFRNLAERCWPVHEAILGIVDPALIVVFGGKAYEFVRDKVAGPTGEVLPTCNSGHGEWMCVAARSPDRRRTIVGLPHLSRYHIIGKTEVIAWIQAIRNGTATTG
jgi:hypothetical protein